MVLTGATYQITITLQPQATRANKKLAEELLLPQHISNPVLGFACIFAHGQLDGFYDSLSDE